MWNSWVLQGLMWRNFNDSGKLTYAFLDTVVAMHPYYIARAIGGLFFLIGAVVGCYNIWMTIRQPAPAMAAPGDEPVLAHLQPAE